MYKIAVLLIFTSKIFAQDLQDSTAYSINLDEFVVTAQYEPTHYKEAIHKIDIIQKEDIEKRGAVTLDQALMISPAIRMYIDPILGASIKMRGIGSSNVAVLIDGIPVIGRENGSLDLSQISVSMVERIEIVEGALSNMYGNNAAGGVINIITSKSQTKNWKANLHSQLESIGQQTINGGLGFNHKKLTLNANGRYLRYDKFPIDSLRVIEDVTTADGSNISQSRHPFNPKEQLGFGGLIRFDPDNESSIIAKYNFNKEKVSDYGVIKRPQYNPYANDQFYDTERSDLSLKFKKNWSGTFLELSSAYNKYDRTVDEKRFYLATSTFDSLLQTSENSSFTTFFNKGIVSHTIVENLTGVGGLNYVHEQGKGDKINSGLDSDSTVARFSELATFYELKYKGLKNIVMSTSGRYTSHSVYHGKFTPSFLIKYNLNNKWIARFGYSQGYRSPSLKELYLEFIDINHNIKGSMELEPETSHDLQLTLNYLPFKDLDISVNLYRTNILNRIGLIEYESLKYRYENIDKYKVYGFQPAVKYKVKNFEIQSSATIGYWDTNITAESTPEYGRVFDMNNVINYIPGNRNLGFTLNHRHVGGQPIYSQNGDEVELRTIESYELLDFSVNKPFFKNKVKLIFGVRNLMNIGSIPISGASTGSAHGQYGSSIISQGRNWFMNISVDL